MQLGINPYYWYCGTIHAYSTSALPVVENDVYEVMANDDENENDGENKDGRVIDT
jgi:hypothetical protein